MALDSIRRAIDFLLGQTNVQQLRRYDGELALVNRLADGMAALSDEELKAKTAEFRARLSAGESTHAVRPEAYAVAREVAERTVGMRPFDVQIVGALALLR